MQIDKQGVEMPVPPFRQGIFAIRSANRRTTLLPQRLDKDVSIMLDILCDENADTLKIRPDTLTACSLVFSRNGFTICDTTALELGTASVFSVSTEKA